uniref:CTLH domain-containing protein n=1 Tax=Meloidogyne enterolobii TaxID=390850 RepID=A0A6V7U8P6_MELEN|nr:unnamed protein product [Meloidogyne enterolobii]
MDSDETFGCLPSLICSNDDDFDGGESSWFNNHFGDANEEYNSVKLHELVIEYLVFSGYKEAADLLIKDAELSPPSDTNQLKKNDLSDQKILENTKNVDTLNERSAIHNCIINGDIETAIRLIGEIAPNLLNSNQKLQFKLLRQQLVELIRNKEVDKVLSFAQSNLADKCSDIPQELFAKLEQTYALLAFDNPETSPFGYLMSLNQRNMLAYEVNEAILSTLNKPSISRLEKLFRVMVWNHHQQKTKDDGRLLTKENAEDISKILFGIREDDGMNELL